ncbi:Hypothetical protein A7982_10562 [Minicystis rosea]|nr:Hypothetical protein A7982_10562 [Minicystis rosea]
MARWSLDRAAFERPAAAIARRGGGCDHGEGRSAVGRRCGRDGGARGGRARRVVERVGGIRLSIVTAVTRWESREKRCDRY